MQRIYPILYFIFICCGFLIGQLYLPGSPLNNLQILTLLMLFICIQCDKTPPCDRFIRLFLYFIIIYFICELITGYVDKFIAFFRTYIFIGYVYYWATKILVMRCRTLWPLIISGMLLGVLDSFVTTFQALGIPITNPWIQALIADESVEEYMNYHDDGMGVAVSGLYLSPVFNGHYLLFFYLVSLLTQIKKVNGWLLIFSFIILVGLFFCQQRSAFYIAISMSFVLYLKRASLSPIRMFSMLFLMTLIVFFALPVLVNYMENSGSRMLSDDDSNRLKILDEVISYFCENPFVVSFHDFVVRKKAYPHNLFLSVIVSGGLFGLFLISRMLYLQFVFVLDKIRYYKSHIGVWIISLCYCGLLLDSLFHNTGWIDGDYATFICWSLCYFSFTYNCEMFLRE